MGWCGGIVSTACDEALKEYLHELTDQGDITKAYLACGIFCEVCTSSLLGKKECIELVCGYAIWVAFGGAY
jgi:hypothetical protein